MTREEFDSLVRLLTNGEKHSERVICQAAQNVSAGGNPYQICDFGEKVSQADTYGCMKELVGALFGEDNVRVRKGDSSFEMHIYEFLFCMVDSGRKNFSVKIISDVLSAENPKLAFYIAGYVDSSEIDREQLKKEIMDSGCAKYIERWIEHFGEDRELSIALKEAKKNKYVPKILEKYRGKEISEIYEDALKSNDPNFITEVAEHVKGVNVKALFDRVLEIGDMLWVYEYMASVDKLPQREKNKGVRFAIKSGMPKFMLYVAEFCGVSDKAFDLLYEEIYKSGDDKYAIKIEEAAKVREQEALKAKQAKKTGQFGE